MSLCSAGPWDYVIIQVDLWGVPRIFSCHHAISDVSVGGKFVNLRQIFLSMADLTNLGEIWKISDKNSKLWQS